MLNSLKKFGSAQKINLKPNKITHLNRSTSVKIPEKTQTLRDILVSKLEHCLIIDQLNTKKLDPPPATERKPQNFILKKRLSAQKSLKTAQKPLILPLKLNSEAKIPAKPAKKRKKARRVPAKKPEAGLIPLERPEKEEESPAKPAKSLVIKQRGLSDY